MTTSRTVLIESNQLFRQGLKHLLADTRFAVEVEFGTTAQALANAENAAASAMVITGQAGKEPGDLDMLRDAYPERPDRGAGQRPVGGRAARRDDAGADGFLMKDVSPEALIQSLQLIMLGEKVFPTNLAAMLLDMNSAPSPMNSLRGLSPREQEILQALVTGASNKLIAIKLGITEATVKVHLKTLLRKIDVNNRTQAAIWAMNNGFTADQAMPTRPLHAVA